MSDQIKINRIAVDSSAILSAGFDHATNTLEVEFTNGYVYQYLMVDPADFEFMMNAKSAGIYFNSFIKGKYEPKPISYRGEPIQPKTP